MSLKVGLAVYVLALLLVWALCIAAADGQDEVDTADWDGAFLTELSDVTP